ncbi:hypothetical protein CMK18_23955 [Candidatus Poribacteria bacterium]|nr:hypothetical protein [Candidatus Poribacteria bacterium]
MDLIIKKNRCKFQFNLNGIKTQQRREVFQLFPPFLKAERFKKVLEIGTHHGGFSQYLHKLSQEHQFTFKTYDIKDLLHDVRKIYGKVPFDYTQADVWCGAGKQQIISEITSSGKCLLLVDGGNKNKEFNIYAPYLKKGDVIMTHDYAPSKEYFQQHIYKQKWLYLESWDDRLNWVENNLKKINPQFQDVVWSCFRKQ